jgi:hypothetical protein
MTIRMILLLFLIAAALMPPSIRAHAEDLNLDAEREAFLARSKAEEDKLSRRRDNYLGTLPVYNGTNSEEAIKPWVDPTATNTEESANDIDSASSGQDEPLPVGPSDANRSDKPVEPLSPEDMFRE